MEINDVKKEIFIREFYNKDEDFKLRMICQISATISSNAGSEKERILEMGIAERMIEHIRLNDLADFLATHIDGYDNGEITGEHIFNKWYEFALKHNH